MIDKKSDADSPALGRLAEEVLGAEAHRQRQNGDEDDDGVIGQEFLNIEFFLQDRKSVV